MQIPCVRDAACRNVDAAFDGTSVVDFHMLPLRVVDFRRGSAAAVEGDEQRIAAFRFVADLIQGESHDGFFIWNGGFGHFLLALWIFRYFLKVLRPAVLFEGVDFVERKRLGVNQQTLADLAGVGLNTLVAIERGEGNPQLNTLMTILDTLGLQMDIKLKTLDYETV